MGRDSSLVRSMFRKANTLSALKSAPGSFGTVNTMVVLSATVFLNGRRPMTMKRVMLSSKSWTDEASEARPNTSPARCDAIAAASSAPESATIFALRQPLRVRVDPRQAVERRPRQRQQMVDHRQFHLADDRQLVRQQQVVVT